MKPPKHRLTPRVVPFDNRQRDAMRVVRALAKDNPERVYFGSHAKERMVQRDISSLSVYRALSVGEPRGEWQAGRSDNETKLEIAYRAKGSREFVVVTAVLTEDRKAFIRTVFWSD